ncbi:DUF1349 domain-containing protein [Paenibacillus sp. JX-17]|uniref:DUF1349 domain-containing protein n=1 Tax=Paenibacillus lacisoli TaxID=3064525 RepID=A0ABT9CA61_9BACL|nr:DUF1349 domain-containing protein [Paenibacillus sp. JX-17]MDO7906141.1 DUF1349 domain-containing protein [Paenibacillus sp. JX-17]
MTTVQNLFSKQEREKLAWMNEPQHWTYTAEHELLIEAPPKADFFKDPAGKHTASSAPFLQLQVDSSFQLTTQLQVDMHHKYDSGCLMLMADDNNWAKICFEFDGEYPTIVSVVTQDGSSDDCNSERVSVENPYLRITKSEQVVSFYYSPDGEAWKLIRYFGLRSQGPYTAGVVAQSPTGSGCEVRFKSLILSWPEAEERF